MKYDRKDAFTVPDTPTDVLKLALEKEKSSYNMYDQMIKKFKDPILTNVLMTLKSAEAGHIKMIESIMKRFGV